MTNRKRGNVPQIFFEYFPEFKVAANHQIGAIGFFFNKTVRPKAIVIVARRIPPHYLAPRFNT